MEPIRPTRQILETFKSDLWKDQRELNQISVGGLDCLEKRFLSQEEAVTESRLLRYLSSRVSVAHVPQILLESSDSITMPYIKGIRLFNLLVELDQLTPPFDLLGREIKSRLLVEANARQAEIQRALMNFEFSDESRVYPAAIKIRSIVNILTSCLGIWVDFEVLDRELADFESRWMKFAHVPFRDATTKNMVLSCPELWLGNYSSEQERSRFLLSTLARNTIPEWAFCPVIDFDFSSCIELSTPEDDWISLNFHERTWSGPPAAGRSLSWGFDRNPERAALGFLVRYYRFGGRKAAYRLLHPWGQRVRFRYDSDQFYFARLPSIMINLWPEAASVFPNLLSVTEEIARNLDAVKPDIDYFIGERLGEKRTYYVDMYVDGQSDIRRTGC